MIAATLASDLFILGAGVGLLVCWCVFSRWNG